MYVDEEEYYLGASPDGLIDRDGIVEIKCPYNSRQLTVNEAVKTGKIKFLECISGELHLKKSHNCYFQIQGQLRITGKMYCYFVVWTPKGFIFMIKLNMTMIFFKHV